MLRWLGTVFAPMIPRSLRDQRQRLGHRGEVVAAKHLRGKGYKVLMCNFVAAGGEIDVVAREGQTLVFVEVKTRRAADGPSPYTQVDGRKRRAMTRAARAYLSHYQGVKPQCRFDVVSIVWPEQGKPEIEHLPNAFEAE